MNPIDIIILSNGPGEVTTWVRPVVRALRDKLGNDRDLVRISVILSPCPNASGKEVQILQSYPEVDRVQDAKHFSKFLVWGKTEATPSSIDGRVIAWYFGARSPWATASCTSTWMTGPFSA